MVIQILGAFIAVVTLSIVNGVPRKFLPYAGAVGAMGWAVYLILDEWRVGNVMRFFVAALTVSIISHSLARILKAPVTIFLISGIIPLVPGTSLYRTVYYIIMNNSQLANYYSLETFQVAGVIALAVFIVDSTFRIVKQK